MTISRIYLKQPLTPRLLLIDGLSRAGKMLMGKLVSHFARVEYFQLSAPIDHIPILWRVGALVEESAAAFLRMQIDYAIYERITGRSLNFRHSDATSIHKAPDFPRYAVRSFETESPAMYDRFNQERRYPAFLTHEILPHIELFFRCTEDLRVIEVERHPVDLALSWHRRGWGERWGRDPLAFIPVLEHKGQPVPWFAAGWADDYLVMRPIDRVIRAILTLTELTAATLESLPADRRRRISVLCYDDLVLRPSDLLPALGSFLESEALPSLREALAREALPAPAPGDTRAKRLVTIRDEEKANPDLVNALIASGQTYEARWRLNR